MFSNALKVIRTNCFKLQNYLEKKKWRMDIVGKGVKMTRVIQEATAKSMLIYMYFDDLLLSHGTSFVIHLVASF